MMPYGNASTPIWKCNEGVIELYTKPKKEFVEEAIHDGWEPAVAERGYDIFNFDGTGLLEIERIDVMYFGHDFGEDAPTDDDCAREAELSGFCKIIPVDELPNPFIIEGRDCRYFGWVDTPENRRAISAYRDKTGI